MIGREEWAVPRSGEPDAALEGSDAELAVVARRNPGGLIDFRPAAGSDLARALGLVPGAGRQLEVAVDALRFRDRWAVNAVVVGVAPGRLGRRHRRSRFVVELDGAPWFAGEATTVVVAVGQYLGGADLVPRGHPGDGRAEVQVLSLSPGQRRRFRSRLAHAEHLPHPQIRQRTARAVVIAGPPSAPVVADGVDRGVVGSGLTLELVPQAYRLAL